MSIENTFLACTQGLFLKLTLWQLFWLILPFLQIYFQHIILLSLQLNEWYLLPDGQGFYGQKSHPWHLNMECQIDILMPRHVAQEGMGMLFM